MKITIIIHSPFWYRYYSLVPSLLFCFSPVSPHSFLIILQITLFVSLVQPASSFILLCSFLYPSLFLLIPLLFSSLFTCSTPCSTSCSPPCFLHSSLVLSLVLPPCSPHSSLVLPVLLHLHSLLIICVSDLEVRVLSYIKKFPPSTLLCM